MNTASSNDENTQKRAKRIPHIGRIIQQLQAEGGVAWGRVAAFALLRLPKFAVMIALFYWLGELALLQPLKKALFSWREGLVFPVGDFLVFFALSCALVIGLLMVLWRFYRNECELLAICNLGSTTSHITFDYKREYYSFEDAQGQTYEKLFVLDYTLLYPLSKRLLADSRDALPNLQLFASNGAEKCANQIAKDEIPATVYYLPRNPQKSQLVIRGRMNEYFWRNDV